MKVTYCLEHKYFIIIGTVIEVDRFGRKFMGEDCLGTVVNACGGACAGADETFGKFVVLVSDIVDKLDTDELNAILAHEEGHIVLSHKHGADTIEQELEADRYAVSKGNSAVVLIKAITKVIVLTHEAVGMMGYVSQTLLSRELRIRINSLS